MTRSSIVNAGHINRLTADAVKTKCKSTMKYESRKEYIKAYI